MSKNIIFVLMYHHRKLLALKYSKTLPVQMGFAYDRVNHVTQV
jgi:hypothetical protein